MNTMPPKSSPLHFFDDTVIAIRYMGHCYGVLPSHPNCLACIATKSDHTTHLPGAATILASDEEALRLTERQCSICGRPLLNAEERGELLRFCTSQTQPSVLQYIFQWSHTHQRYEANLNGETVFVSWGQMANTLYKCIHTGLDEKRAFDAREWERGHKSALRFIVLKKRAYPPHRK